MAAIPTAQYTQKDWRAGSTVTAPTANTMMLVMEVMVMATPALFRVRAIISSWLMVLAASVLARLEWHWTMTNMSSMPIPTKRKGMMACMGLNTRPAAEQMP